MNVLSPSRPLLVVAVASLLALLPAGLAHATTTATVDAVDDVVQMRSGGTMQVPVLDNDLVPEGATPTLRVTTEPSNGTATVSGTQIVYVPELGFTGSDTFGYELVTGQGSDTASVSVTIAGAVGEVPDDGTVDDGTPDDGTVDDGTPEDGSGTPVDDPAAVEAGDQAQESAYANCDEAEAAGATPLTSDNPDYAPHLDPDGDGLACEDDTADESLATTGSETGLAALGALALAALAAAAAVRLRRA